MIYCATRRRDEGMKITHSSSSDARYARYARYALSVNRDQQLSNLEKSRSQFP